MMNNGDYRRVLKKGFVDIVSGGSRYVKARINKMLLKANQLEIHYNRDISEFNKEQLIQMLNECSDKATLFTNASLINKYNTWCAKNKGRAVPVLLTASDLGLNLKKSMRIYNPNDFDRFISTLYPDDNMQYVYIVHKATAWLIYSGVHCSDTFGIMNDDVDIDRASLRYGKYIVPLYEQSLPCISQCLNCDSLRMYIGSNTEESYFPRKSGSTLLRPVDIKGDSTDIGSGTNRFHSSLRRRLGEDFVDGWDILKLGMFYRLNEYLKNEIVVDGIQREIHAKELCMLDRKWLSEGKTMSDLTEGYIRSYSKILEWYNMWNLSR